MTLEKACKIILFDKPFFGLFLLGMNKEYSTRVPTAAVAKKGIGVELLVNEEFWNELSDKIQEGILIHEIYHLCFNHLLMWDLYENKSILGLAADLEVNSYIDRDMLPENGIFNENYGLPPALGLKKYYEILNIIDNMPNSQMEDGESEGSGNQKDNKNNGSGGSSSNQDDKQNNGNEPSAQNIVDGLSSKNKKDIKNLIDNQDFTHKEWKDFDNLSDAEKENFHRMRTGMSEEDASLALYRLSDYLCRYYGKKVIILLDEYDTPMQEAYVDGFWEELVSFTRNLFNSTFKTNPYLERAVMTDRKSVV